MVNTEPSGTPAALTKRASIFSLSSLTKTTMKRPSVRAATSGSSKARRVGDGDFRSRTRAIEEPRLNVLIVAADFLFVDDQGVVHECRNRRVVLIVGAIVDECPPLPLGAPPASIKRKPISRLPLSWVATTRDRPSARVATSGLEPGIAVENSLWSVPGKLPVLLTIE